MLPGSLLHAAGQLLENKTSTSRYDDKIDWQNPLTWAGGFQFLLIIGILIFLRWHLHKVREGSEASAEWLLLPSYVTLLQCYAVAKVFIGVNDLINPVEIGKYNTLLISAAAATGWAVEHFFLEGVAFFLLQKGAGRSAMRRAARYAAAWALFTWGCVFVFFRYDYNVVYGTWSLISVAFYMYISLTSTKRLFRRPGLDWYARFFSLYCCLRVVYGAFNLKEVKAWRSGSGEGQDFWDNVNMIVWSIQLFIFFAMSPFFLYYALLTDSQYWQGWFHTRASKTEADRRHTKRGGTHRKTTYDKSLLSPLMAPMSRETTSILINTIDSHNSGNSNCPVAETSRRHSVRQKKIRFLSWAQITLFQSR